MLQSGRPVLKCHARLIILQGDFNTRSFHALHAQTEYLMGFSGISLSLHA